MIKGKHTRIAGGAKFWSGNTAMVGGLISKPVIINQQNFVSSPSMPSWLTLTRLSSATYLNSSGNMVEVAADTARFDNAFNGTAWAAKGLLLEKAATNRLGNSDYAAGVTGWNSTDAQINYSVKSNGTLYVEGLRSGTDRPIFSNPSAYRILNIPLSTSATISVFLVGSRGINYNYAMRFTSGNTALGSFPNLISSDKNTDALKTRTSITFNLTEAVTNGDMLLGTNVVNQWMNIGYPQVELGSYPTSWIRTSTAAVTRAQDNLQLNISNYTGSIKLTYKRQDTDATESAWIDLTNATNPILTNSVAVGIWLQNISVYNRTLTAQEKANA